MVEEGWNENKCYPGTHWLYYQYKGRNLDYVARVDFASWTKGRYMWRVFGPVCGIGDRVGWADSLEEAQREAKRVYQTPVEKPLPIGQLKLF